MITHLIKKLLNIKTNPDKWIIKALTEIKSEDPDVRIQEIRKRNLQRVIIQFYNGSILEYANTMYLHLLSVKGLLLPVEKRVSRNITDKTARLIECRLHLKSGVLDEESAPIFERDYIPFINIPESIDMGSLFFNDKAGIKYTRSGYLSQNLILLDTSSLEQLTIQTDSKEFESFHHEVLGKTAVINRNTDKIITLFKNKGKFELFGEVIDWI